MKAQEFLEAAGIKPKIEVNAKKEKLGEAEAMELIAEVAVIHAAKGKRVVHLNLKKDSPEPDDIKKLILGPTGNLRAPTLRIGNNLIVGFNQEMYQQVFGV